MLRHRLRETDRRTRQQEPVPSAATSTGAIRSLRRASRQLVTGSDRLDQRITSPNRPDPVRVFFTTCPAPYSDAQELIGSVTDDRMLEVTTVATDSDRGPADG